MRAYETSTDTYAEVAAQFAIGLNTLLRWVQRAGATGDVAPFDKNGGWQSPVDWGTLQRLGQDTPDRTTYELTRADNREVAAGQAGCIDRAFCAPSRTGPGLAPSRASRAPSDGPAR